MRLSVFKIIKKVGFWGILLCASIPNPLFDLAGITCGHFLVRFWTVFGATLIGKAIIKMHIQLIFVIFLFSQHHLDTLFALVAKMPYVGERAQTLFQEWLNGEKTKLHRAKSGASGGANVPGESLLSWVLGKIVLTMIIFFVVSIVNSLAQRRYKRLNTPTHVMKKIASD
jgi:small-conductance mechanosensitive channel